MSDAQVDALLEALGAEGSNALMAELLKTEETSPDPLAAKPAQIRARVKELAARRPDLLAKIITYWVKEERKGR